MDQTLVNWLFAACGATLGWLVKVIWDAITELKKDIREIEKDLPEIYVRKDDFRDLKQDMKEGFNKIDNLLNLIFKKLEQKEDK